MKLPKHFLLALLGAICLGIAIGATFRQVRAGEYQQQVLPTIVAGGPSQQGDGPLNQSRAQQPPKPELEVKPGDSEEIKVLKIEIKELRERVFKLEEKTSWRIRPAAER